MWDDDEFVALIDLARSKYDEKKWYLHLDEDVSPQESHIASIDESTFLKIFEWVDWVRPR